MDAGVLNKALNDLSAARYDIAQIQETIEKEFENYTRALAKIEKMKGIVGETSELGKILREP